jgi:hypothetical protein
MEADEREIIDYLKAWGKDFVSVKEVCRRAGTRRRFNEDSDWARPIILLLFERGVVERDPAGRYRVKVKAKHEESKRWVSPHIAALLEEGGVENGSTAQEIPEEDDAKPL